jgi:hypothetical protein
MADSASRLPHRGAEHRDVAVSPPRPSGQRGACRDCKRTRLRAHAILEFQQPRRTLGNFRHLPDGPHEFLYLKSTGPNVWPLPDSART